MSNDQQVWGDFFEDEKMAKIDAGLEKFVNEFKGLGVTSIAVDPTNYPTVKFVIRTQSGAYTRKRDVSND